MEVAQKKWLRLTHLVKCCDVDAQDGGRIAASELLDTPRDASGCFVHPARRAQVMLFATAQPSRRQFFQSLGNRRSWHQIQILDGHLKRCAPSEQ
ncbi:hypothetical protein [Sphingomonas turrisvirgatae]|uniref:Uncharacterized protein n=1 Tax=Sphingomonas turrisvirgatae TaxID=1888892 RepID=A0A1E3LYK6_9SPHN|nr:hypothetical protein [Sphingomonas turrisvirgatae]ODP38804.1 hypothetical protein BFL28_13515 [Sphingomonas turrisvirgatae]